MSEGERLDQEISESQMYNYQFEGNSNDQNGVFELSSNGRSKSILT